MGQQMMIIALLASFLVSMGVIGLRDAWSDSADIAVSQYEQESVLNLSSSGVSMALSKLRQEKTWTDGYSNVSMMEGGKIDVNVTSLGGDSVRITSMGTFNGHTHTSVVEAKVGSAVPMAESALAIYGDEVNFANAGKAFGIDGNDHDENGNRVVGDPVSGMSVPSAAIATDLRSQLVSSKVAKNVTGTGSNPSVGVSTIPNSKVIEMRDYFRDRATTVLDPGKYAGNTVYGSMDKPEIVYLKGDVRWTGTVKGTGVLIVDGSLRVGGNWNWTGLVISVTQDIDLEFGDSGNPEVNGAVMIGTEVPSPYKVTNVKINGNPQLNYSNSALTKVMANLGMNEIEIKSYYE